MSSVIPFIAASGLMLIIGLGCLMLKRDMVRLLIGIEILFNAANLVFIAMSGQMTGFVDPYAHSIVTMAIVLDGTVIAVGLAMVLNAYKHYKTLDIRKLRRLRW